MYNLIKVISSFLRIFILENPFEEFIELYFQNTPLEASYYIFAYILNLAVGPVILHNLCYWLVGRVYVKNENPAAGSLLYLLLFWFNSVILVWICNCTINFSFKIFIVILVIVIAIEVFILKWIRNIKDEILYL